MEVSKGKSNKLIVWMLVLCMIVTSCVIPSKKAEAAGTYWLKVNRTTNTVTAYRYKNGEYKPVRVMLCSVGRNGATPRGNFHTLNKYRWHTLNGPVYGQYCTRIYKGFLFHSVWYYEMNKSSQTVSQYNKLGQEASHGCVRLSVADAKWIYDNCSLGTKVTIYDSKNPGPLGKPKLIKVTNGKRMDWDPTDPDPNNPYIRKRPKIKFSSRKPREVALYSQKYDREAGVSARSYRGKNLRSKLKIRGKVNTKVPGTYTLNYFVRDAEGYYAQRDLKVKVLKPSKPLLRVKDRNITLKIGNSTVSRYMKKGIAAVDRNGKNITDKITLSCSDPSVKIYRNGKVTFTEPGTFKMIYSVTGSKKNGARTNRRVSLVKVQDDSTPSIHVENAVETISIGDTYTSKEIRRGVTASTVKGTDLNSELKYAVYKNNEKVRSIDTSEPGEYVIRYAVLSPTGRRAAGMKTLRIEDLSDPVVLIGGSAEFTTDLTETKEVKEEKIRENVSFRTEKGTTLTEWSYEIYEMQAGQTVGLPVSIEKLESGKDYRVYLFCKNPNSGKQSEKTEYASRIMHVK